MSSEIARAAAAVEKLVYQYKELAIIGEVLTKLAPLEQHAQEIQNRIVRLTAEDALAREKNEQTRREAVEFENKRTAAEQDYIRTKAEVDSAGIEAALINEKIQKEVDQKTEKMAKTLSDLQFDIITKKEEIIKAKEELAAVHAEIKRKQAALAAVSIA